MDNYQYLGIGFIAFGVPFAAYSYLVLFSIPLTALGLGTLILGLALLQIPSSPIPGHHIRAMVEASLVNIEALLEEYDARGKAVYLMVGERVNAFIPLREGPIIDWLILEEIPNRVLTRIGDVEGLLVFPPGSELVRLALLPEEIGAEDALNSVLVDLVESVDIVKAVVEGDQVVVELFKPKNDARYMRIDRCLGSLPVSIAGCVLAEAMGKSVLFQREEAEGLKVSAFYRLLGESG